MRIIKPLRLGLLTRPYTYRKQHQLGVAALALISLEANPALMMEGDLWRIASQELDEDEVLDLGMPKPCAEFLVSGKAYAHDTASPERCAVRVRVDDQEKSLIVTGDRSWGQGGMSNAAAVNGVPVNWRHTYGGPDFQENPFGIGAARGLDGIWHVPNVEPLEGRVVREGQVGVPVSFGPVSPVRPRRFKRAGRYEESWLRDGFPGLPETLDPHFFNAASPDQWFADRPALDPGMQYEIWNMHPQRQCLSSTLPAWRARCFIRRHDESDIEEVGMRHTTAWFFPDQERVLLMFHGLTAVRADDASDVAVIMPALEALDDPRSIDHYRSVLAQRLPRDSGALYALRDKDLLPAQGPRSQDDLSGSGVLARPQVVNQRQRAANLKVDMLQRAQAAGQNPADYQLDGQSAAPLECLDDLPDYMRSMRRKTRLMKADMLRKRRDAQATLSQTFKDSPQASAGAAALSDSLAAPPPGGPPRVNRGTQAAAMLALAQDAEAGGAANGAFKPGQVQTMLNDAQSQLANLYRHAAHHQSPAESALGGRSVRMRRRVQNLMQGSRDLSGLDLTGVDLSGMDLSGARCRGTWMEMARLQGATLVGADLSQAVLTRARLANADLSDAILDGANLGEIVAHETTFTRARFNETTLDRALLAQCRFDGATFKDCQPADVDISDCSFEASSFDNVTFWQQSRLVRTTFRQATLRRVIWVDCGLDELDYSGANLTSCAWVQSLCLSPLNFHRSRLTTCCAVQCDLTGALFTDAFLLECSLRGLDLDYANFDGARLQNCDLSETSLRNARFLRADASGSLFMESDFTGADLRESDLIDALMQKSDLRDADLSRANLFRADLSQGLLDASSHTAGAYIKMAKTLPAAPDPRGAA